MAKSKKYSFLIIIYSLTLVCSCTTNESGTEIKQTKSPNQKQSSAIDTAKALKYWFTIDSLYNKYVQNLKDNKFTVPISYKVGESYMKSYRTSLRTTGKPDNTRYVKITIEDLSFYLKYLLDNDLYKSDTLIAAFGRYDSTQLQLDNLDDVYYRRESNNYYGLIFGLRRDFNSITLDNYSKPFQIEGLSAQPFLFYDDWHDGYPPRR